jgi:ketosteroid isomerase-like protein
VSAELPTLPKAVQALVDAANRGDTPAFLAGFTPDGVVDDWGREFRGAADIQGWSDTEFIGAEVALEVEEVELDGTRTIVAATVGGNGFNGPSTFTFTTVGGLVSRMMIRG